VSVGRPDKSEERIEQILDAFEACVASHGLEGTTLEMVAEQACVQRSLIRHYLGNRDAVLIAWAQRSIDRYRESLDQLVDALPKRKPCRALVDHLFLRETEGPTDAELVLDLLIARSDRHDECRSLISSFIQEMVTLVAGQLVLENTSASRSSCFEVANAIVAMSFCAESLSPLRLPSKHKKAWKKVARQLVASLE
jgi:AcrR family transcriptional regulator